jgi:hypothetical protein
VFYFDLLWLPATDLSHLSVMGLIFWQSRFWFVEISAIFGSEFVWQYNTPAAMTEDASIDLDGLAGVGTVVPVVVTFLG